MIRRVLESPGRPSRGAWVNGYAPDRGTPPSRRRSTSRRWRQASAAFRSGGRSPTRLAYVLDRAGQPVPVGVHPRRAPCRRRRAGARLSRPAGADPRALRRDRPRPPRSGRREVRASVYRTGDIVRWLPDRTLDFLGRVDRQVKLRGFRVELAEIEAALTLHPGVAAQGFVQVQGDGGDTGGWSATTRRGSPASRRNGCWPTSARPLPAYTLPAALLRLDAFPVSAPNGKLDLAALPRGAAGSRRDGGAGAIHGDRSGAGGDLAGSAEDRSGRNPRRYSSPAAAIPSSASRSWPRPASTAALTPRQLFEAGTIERLAQCGAAPGRAGRELGCRRSASLGAVDADPALVLRPRPAGAGTI